MNEALTSAVRDIAELAVSGRNVSSFGPPSPGDATPYVVLPDNYRAIDLERLLPRPTRARGNTTVRDLASFIMLTKEQISRDASGVKIYSSDKPAYFIAVLNSHAKEPGWGDHRISYTCPIAEEWTTWEKSSGSRKSQVNFAEFIEDNALDIVAAQEGQPTSADMLEISRTFEARKKASFASAIRLDNGAVEFSYEEQIEGTAGKGKLRVPQSFWVGIEVFQGGPRYSMECRLRYRINSGVLEIWYERVRAHKIVEDAVRQMREAIEAQTGLKTINGTPS